MKIIAENEKNFNLGVPIESRKIKGCQPLDNIKGANPTFSSASDVYVLQKNIKDWLFKYTDGYDWKTVKRCGMPPKKDKPHEKRYLPDLYESVQLRMNDKGKAFFHGYATCDNNWLCPVCSRRISYLRGLEVLKAGQWALANGYSLAMITLTNQHTRGMLPATCMDIHLNALKEFNDSKAIRDYLKPVSVGWITGNEVLHGENGCHFHSHRLVILKQGCTISADIEKRLRKSWADNLVKAGLKDSSVKVLSKKAMDIQLDCSVSSYISKWGVDKELTATGSKEGHGMNLFEVFMSGDYKTFAKYAYAFSPRRNREIGQQVYKLRWSKGLKGKVGLKDLNDRQIQNEEAKEAILIALIGADAWKYIMENGLRKTVLEAVEHGGYKELVSMLYCHSIELNCFGEFDLKNYLSVK